MISLKSIKKIVFIFSLISVSAVAQKGNSGVVTGAGDQNNRYLDMFQSFQKKINTAIPLNELEGSPYIEEAFRKGQIFEADSSRGQYLLRYNVFNDVMEVLMDDKDIMELKKERDVKVLLSNKRYKIYHYISPEGEPAKGYFEILEDGDRVDFLRKYFRTFEQGERAKTSFHVEKKPRFESNEEYYLYFNNENVPVEIKKLKKKYVTGILEDNGIEVDDYIKEADLDLDEEGDVIKLVQYLNKKG